MESIGYPGKDFVPDHHAQARANGAATARIRRMKVAGGVAGTTFVVAAGSEFINKGITPPFVVAVVATLGAFFVMVILPIKRLRCSKCGRPMKREWVHIAGGEKALFQVCGSCRRYVDTHAGTS